jgi:hypothetical protein
VNISGNFRKIKNGPYRILRGTGGKLIHEKNLKWEIWWHCPFIWFCECVSWKLESEGLGVLLFMCKSITKPPIKIGNKR